MYYKEYTVPEQLKKYIKCFWTLERNYGENPYTYEHLWANINTELIFTSGSPFCLVKSENEQQQLPDSFLIFPFDRELLLTSAGVTQLVAVRFQPWAVHKFMNKPINAFINKITNAEIILGNGEIFLQQLKGAPKEEQVGIISQYFLSRMKGIEGKEIFSQSIAEEIIKKQGVVGIRELSEVFGINPRKMERDFMNEIGISAKLFSRIVRFSNARVLLARNPNSPLAMIAYEVGYADQAHFSKDFKEFFGITPANFRKQLISFIKYRKNNESDVVFLQDIP